MCTIEVLCTLLNDCKLYNILSIISNPGMIILYYYLINYLLSIFYFIYIYIMILEPLNIIMHPTEEFPINILKVSFGYHLHLCCKAVGMPPPNYIWYHNDEQLQYYTSDELDLTITKYIFNIKIFIQFL